MSKESDDFVRNVRRTWSVVIITAVVCGVCYFIFQSVKPKPTLIEERCASIEERVTGDGREQYDKLKSGMSLSEVESIIGFEGDLTMSSNNEEDRGYIEASYGTQYDTSSTYNTWYWQLNKNTSITIDFINGKMSQYSTLSQNECK